MEKQRSVTHPSSASKLPRSIYIIGLVSLLNDVATDMVIPIVPIFLASTLGAAPFAVMNSGRGILRAGLFGLERMFSTSRVSGVIDVREYWSP